MKIIHLISGNLGNGGAERLVLDLANEQAEMGSDITICCFRSISNVNLIEKSEKVKLYSFLKKKGFDLFLPFSLYRFFLKEKPDVVNCHLPAVFLYVYLSLILCKKTKFFYTIHNDPIQEEPRLIIRKLRRFLIKRKILIPIAISNIIKEKFEFLYNISNIEFVSNGRKKIFKTIDFEKVSEEIRGYKKNNDTLVFIAVGRISKEKNHQLLIRVFAELERKKENVILLIIGNDYGWGLLEECLKIKSDNTFFLGSKQNVSDYLFCSDVFCLSSIYEGLPISILEAISIGLPIISTNVGGIPDIVKDSENGFLVNSLEQSDYLATVEKYLQLNKDEIQYISINNKLLFEKEFNIVNTAKSYLKVYQKYINK
jgi:glycosyltransferase involved in cell wall biosynthesis